MGTLLPLRRGQGPVVGLLGYLSYGRQLDWDEQAAYRDNATYGVGITGRHWGFDATYEHFFEQPRTTLRYMLFPPRAATSATSLPSPSR